jgi:hypothetical protein
MKPFPLFRSVAACVVVAAALAVSTGCASGPDAKGTVDSMGTLGIEVAKVKDSIDGTIGALEAVAGTQPGDLKSNSEAFTQSVTALDAQSKVVRGHAEAMRAKGDEFFKAREGSATVSAERRAELAASYAKIKADMALAKEQFAPFLASLKDIEGYLSLDPSLKGVQAMATFVAKAKDNGAQVKSHIDAVLAQVNSVRGMLDTTK